MEVDVQKKPNKIHTRHNISYSALVFFYFFPTLCQQSNNEQKNIYNMSVLSVVVQNGI